MRAIGYHGTCKKYRNSIEKVGFDPKKCNYRSDHWLGQGVYFFDDEIKAQWWAKEISKQNGFCGAIAYSATIEAPDDEVLDLDDNNQLDCFLSVILENCDQISRCNGKKPIFTDEKFRAVFFDYYKIENNISVIIATFQKELAGYTSRRTPEEARRQKAIMNIIGIRFRERQICVSKKECIKAVELVYNEEEEVI